MSQGDNVTEEKTSLLFLLPPPSPLSLAAMAGILGGAGWYSGPLGFLVAHGLGGPPHVLLTGVVNTDFGRRRRLWRR